jgi:DNA mismatch repair protein MutS2
MDEISQSVNFQEQKPSETAVSRALEWDRFLSLAEEEALSEPAKLQIKQLSERSNWANSLAAAKLLQQETLEVTPLLDREALWGPLNGLQDPESVLERLQRGSVLEINELSTLRKWLYAIESWAQVPREDIRGERFKKSLSLLPDPLNPIRILEKVLTPDGELSENASPGLAAIYSEIRSLRREIGNTLDHLVKSYSQKGILQETFTDVRDGRYVLPVKISSQNEIDGIIYETSGSRQTVFVEPKEIAALNNRLRLRQNNLTQEIYIILEATSKSLIPFASEIRQAVLGLTFWDCTQAKARFGRKYSGKTITVSEDRSFFLQQTAHPLLWWSMPPEEIIRNEIDFAPPTRTLLLTGPNTGGKTVILKTLGLAGICARTGFPFPATDQPIVPYFDSFFADLGDPQSIEQHLSSFSGHVLRFKEILEKLTDNSLILIDELNSATDPEEGAAFGRAVLETIMSQGAMVVTTTHDPQLKALSVSDKRILNASMAFDERARTPTFRMLLGVPGRSRALETAERLGIPLEVVQLAKSYLSREHNEFERMLAKLESDTKKEWTEKTSTSINDLLDRTRQKLRRILEQAQDEVRSSVRKLDEMKSRREIDKTRSSLNETLQQGAHKIEVLLMEEAPDIAKAIAHKPPNAAEKTASGIKLEVAGKVRIPKWKSTGTVLEITGNKVRVSVGTMQMMLSSNDLEVISGATQKPPQVHTQVKETQGNVGSQLDLRGIRFEEAMSQLTSFLDHSFRNDAIEVSVIHGLGTGALREGTHKLLKKLPYIKEFRDGGAGHGGTGATVIEFERD